MRAATSAYGVVTKVHSNELRLTRTAGVRPRLFGRCLQSTDPGEGSGSRYPDQWDFFVVKLDRVDETAEGRLCHGLAGCEQAKGAGDIQKGRWLVKARERPKASPPPELGPCA